MKINLFNNYSKEIKFDYEKIIKDVESISDIYEDSGVDKDSEINLILVESEEIHQMNKDYRGKDYVTDVISFENDEGFEKYDGFIVLGDLFICVSKAKSQAKNYGHSMYREVCFLFTHGLLHLLKMDHLNKEDEEKMFKMQDEIMDHFKIIR